MGLILKQVFQFIKLLNSENGTNQIAAGLAAGFILGMTPALSLQTLFVFVCIFLFRIQAGAAMVSAGFFSFADYLLDPVFDLVGRKVLELSQLQETFVFLYNLPIVPFTRFNNSIVMGSGVFTIVASPFVFVIARMLVLKYQKVILERFKNTKIWKGVQATALYKWYFKYDQLYGA